MQYFDPIRQKAIPATPEEAVRQRTILWLIGTIKVPKHLIETEFPLSKIQVGNPNRVDIIVHNFREKKSASEPWLLVECKRKGVNSPQALQVQLGKYLHVLKPKYIMLPLGETDIYLALAKDKKSYTKIEFLPEYPPISQP
ncbi:MAG: type I restriction enzyme HsdR N-terminal domain-containing protein [Fibrobacteraceae bacterium]|nr:type I restriction enzyme HsdR N-terminal domain-containing protein [Fibrobacteraceae bacterium]